MDQFSYFIVFYSIVLGLAVTELLGGLARMVRARALRKIEAQTALVAMPGKAPLCLVDKPLIPIRLMKRHPRMSRSSNPFRERISSQVTRAQLRAPETF